MGNDGTNQSSEAALRHVVDRIVAARIGEGLRALQLFAYANSQEKGFHDKDEWAKEIGFENFLNSTRLALIMGEGAEALDELRKPEFDLEKVMDELADVVIRTADLAHTLGGDLGAAVNTKMAFNATRPAMHGKKF